MSRIFIDYRQMIAAKQVYHDMHEDVIDAIYKCCGGSNLVVEVLEKGAELIVKNEDRLGIFRVYDRESKVIRFNDILSILVIGEAHKFVVDQVGDRVLITLVVYDNAPMRALLTSTDSYNLGHLKVRMVSALSK